MRTTSSGRSTEPVGPATPLWLIVLIWVVKIILIVLAVDFLASGRRR